MSEVRPIDANALLKEATTKFDWNDCVDVEDIKNAPTLDYEPVVRCKDCKHHYMLHNRLFCKRTAEKIGIDLYCGLTAIKDNHFCSYGAKMDENLKGVMKNV